MKERLARLMPSRESLHQNRWLRFLGPALHHPRLWRMSRKGLALGMALGIFFGLLIPVAQIPCSAALAVLLRANVPVAVASTLVTNPVTFGPVYYGAYHLGQWVLADSEPGGREAGLSASPAPQIATPAGADESASLLDQLAQGWAYLTSVGKPLVVGLAITATVSGLLIYFLVSALWVLKTRRARRRRLVSRAALAAR